ncbi:hypothetical protein B0T17DRAFT_582703 [Bombardia bombarda]|uniref:Uncharacterized protein n=1 Tax=Bombardia bombarda TaxID=252184 RepID=A0AA39WGJ1_9PEZI|nr:hypothetical protein B0T17DRAFT_582703 [Bombardia bombarda]
MKACLQNIWVPLALFVGLASADCASYGVDYSNGGKYQIDGSSNQYFTFITVFQGCTQESITPVLVGPDSNEYVCSAVKTQPSGSQVTSTCGIPFSSMKSGTWKIIISGSQIATQRVITVTVGVPQTTWITVTPTVVVGYTTTAKASTVLSTVSQTQTLILVPSTVTTVCSGGTRTITNIPNGPTVTASATVTKTETDRLLTSSSTTVVTSTAVCHYPSGKVAAVTAAIAAVTSTYTQTTFTVTSTVRTTVPARTVTEIVLRTVTATVTPAPSTACINGGSPGSTVTVTRGPVSTVTQTSIIYQTTHLTGTVWIGQTEYTTYTNPASATACWRAGGWIG